MKRKISGLSSADDFSSVLTMRRVGIWYLIKLKLNTGFTVGNRAWMAEWVRSLTSL